MMMALWLYHVEDAHAATDDRMRRVVIAGGDESHERMNDGDP